MRSTTVIAVRRDNRIALAGDGQVTLGDAILKEHAQKVRRIYNDKILVGFAGATADALTLFERFEAKLNQFSGDLTRSAVELAKEWRTERSLRRLEALMLCADVSKILLLSGNGDVIEPDEGVLAIGSGGNYAYAAALSLLTHTKLSAVAIVTEAMKIAARICVYTNQNIIVEEIT